jgi:dolichyl-phosphate beta-glucosyltransferase
MRLTSPLCLRFFGIFGLLFIITGAALCRLLVSDVTLYDRTLLPLSDPNHLSYWIHPPPDDGQQTFSNIFTAPEVYVSLVIPAYNEAKRLPPMLDSSLEYFQARARSDKSFTYEILIVDDGSSDNQNDVVLEYASRFPREIRLLKQPVNMGKGAAVQAGCLHARGQLILFADADGATPTSQFGRLEAATRMVNKNTDAYVVIGSRANLDGASKAERTAIRRFLSLGFAFLAWLSGLRGVRDPQCGFKLFSRQAARLVFPSQHIERWCMDVELLTIAQRLRIPVVEVPVEWKEIGGSKLKPKGVVRMAVDLVRIAVFHRSGLWTVKAEQERAEDL